jgi:hypothetical protein
MKNSLLRHQGGLGSTRQEGKHSKSWKWRKRSSFKGYVEHRNNVGLNSAIGDITPKGMLAGAPATDSGRAGSEVGGGEGTAEESPPAGRVTDETDYFRLADNSGIRGDKGAYRDQCSVR